MLKLFALAVVAILLVGGGLLGYLFHRGRASLPQTEGAARLAGLTGPVDVVRSGRGVPHLTGSDLRDVVRAMGYVHAQDRYFQMELARRVASGRLAEIFGPEAIPHDREVRRIGLAQAAASELDRMSAEAREVLEAYAAGVNAYRSTHAETLPPEFQILEHMPEPWSATDSLVIGKWFAYALSSNGRAELMRARLVDVVGLRNAYLLTGLTPPAEEDEAVLGIPAPYRIGSIPSGSFGVDPGASNAWAVASERSLSGRPLLAADPHLTLLMPSIFYEIHLSGGGVDVAGASLPGVPMVLFGQNERIAWGMTALFADVQDIYLETTNPQNPGEYAYGDQWAAFDVVSETIAVKDGPAVTEEVRVTRHGVVIGETSDGRLLAQRWDAIWSGDHISALIALNRAGSWEEFTEALRGWSAPALAFVYADVEGNIGFFPAGAIPVRVGYDGVLPVDGKTGEREWSGSIPHELKPMIFNPEGGVIVSANQTMFEADTPYPLGFDTLSSFRARRIASLIDVSPKLSLDDFERMQNDRYDMSTEALLRFAVALRSSDEREARAVEILRAWNGQMDGGPAPLIYYALYGELLRNTFADELGEEAFEPFLEFLEIGHSGGIYAILEDEASPFWDDRQTPEVETRERVFEKSLGAALALLTERFGSDVEGWDWGEAHGVRFQHPLGREEPLSFVLSRGPVPFGGSTFTVANAAVSLRRPFETTVGTSFRFLADLAELGSSRAVVPTGASGHPLSPHYFDQNREWLSGESHPLAGPPETKLVLKP